MPIKKIAFLLTRGDSIGGAQIHVRDFSRSLKTKGIDVLIFVGSKGALCDELTASDIPWEILPGLVRNISPLKDLIAMIRLASRLRKYKPDLLSTHTAKSGLVGRWAAWLAGVPSLFTAHGWQFAEGISAFQKSVVLNVERFTAPLCKRIITVSQYDYDLALHFKVVTPDKLRLVHNGMPRRLEAPDAPVPRDFTQNPVKLIMVARFQEQKDHFLLLEALSTLQNQPWSLDLVGDGPLMEKTRTYVNTLNLNQRVNFLGQRMDVPELLDKADVYILTSHWEGFPRSILEGMRAGLPVIASDVGGVREAVVPQVTGFLIPEGDKDCLIKALASLLGDESLRRVLGKNGRKRFEADFTFESMFEKTWKVYQEVIGSEK